MKIIFCAILFWLSIFAALAGEGNNGASNSLVATYYSNAKSLLKSNPTESIFWADKAISESKNEGNKLELCRSLFQKGVAFEYLHQNKAAIQFIQESLKVAENSKLADLEMDALDKLSALFAKTGDFKSAVQYASLLQDRKDSNTLSKQRALSKNLPGKADLKNSEIKMKQLLADKSAIDDHLRENLKSIDNQGKWILVIVIAYGLIFLSLIIIKRQNRLILLKNQVLTDQMHALEIGKMELEHNRYKAEESERLKTAFLANISSEIRKPLNAITSFAGFLRQKGKPVAEQKKYIDSIHQYSESLLSFISEIFEVARIESGEIKQNIEMIDVKEFLEKIYHQYCLENKPSIRENQKLVLHLSQTEPVRYIQSDRERLRHVVLHLIENAFQYSDNGAVEFGYVIKEPFIEFYVRGDGKGFQNKQIEDIFERFNTTNDFQEPGPGALGLGLTISKNFIESMGGHIGVKSDNDCGSTFFFTLPFRSDLKQ